MVKEIELQNRMVVLVDDEDYERVNQHIWSMSVGASISITSNVEGERIQLTRFILCDELNEKDVVTHRDGNQFNKTKENLIISTRKLTRHMSKGEKNTSSKYKGVSWSKGRKKWVARIYVNGKNMNLGGYVNEDDAAMAYNKAAIKYFGEQSYKNVIGIDNNSIEKEKNKTNQIRRKGKSGFRGVHLQGKKLKVEIKVDGRKNYLGIFNTAEEAAKEFDKKAYELHGDKAILNFPELIEEYKVIQR